MPEENLNTVDSPPPNPGFGIAAKDLKSDPDNNAVSSALLGDEFPASIGESIKETLPNAFTGTSSVYGFGKSYYTKKYSGGTPISEDQFKETYPDAKVKYYDGMTDKAAELLVEQQELNDKREFFAQDAHSSNPITSVATSFAGSAVQAVPLIIAAGFLGEGALGVAGLGELVTAARTTWMGTAAVGAAESVPFTALQIPMEKYTSDTFQKDYGAAQMTEDAVLNAGFGGGANLLFKGIGVGAKKLGTMFTTPSERGGYLNAFKDQNNQGPLNLTEERAEYHALDSAIGSVLQGKTPDMEAAMGPFLKEEKNNLRNTLDSMKKNKMASEESLQGQEKIDAINYEKMDFLEQQAKAAEYGLQPDDLPDGVSFEEAHSALKAVEYAQDYKPEKTKSLFQYLKEKGGLLPDEESFAGELKSRDITSKNYPGLLRKTGMSLDDAALAAQEGGYFADRVPPDRRPDVGELLNLIEEHIANKGKAGPEAKSVQDNANMAEKFLGNHGINAEAHIAIKKSEGAQNAAEIRSEITGLKAQVRGPDKLGEVRNKVNLLQDKIRQLPGDEKLQELTNRHFQNSLAADNSSAYHPSDLRFVDDKFTEHQNKMADNLEKDINERLSDRQSRDDHVAEFERIETEQANRERGIDAAYDCLTRG